MTKFCYWLNPDLERQHFYHHYRPHSSTRSLTPDHTNETRVDDRRRKRRRTNGYTPNEKEKEANEQHSEILPVLEEALSAFIQWRKGSIASLMALPSGWIEPGEITENNDEHLSKCEELSHTFVTTSPWVTLEKMKRIVKPKFRRWDGGVQSATDLFGKMKCNNDNEEVVCIAHDEMVLIPPRSSFLMSDLSDLRLISKELTSVGLFDLVLLDIPWENKSVHRGQKYETIPNRQLRRIPLPSFIKPNLSFACFWLTNRMKLINYLFNELLPAWRLKPLTTWYWVKVDTSGDLISSLKSNHRRPYEKLMITIRSEASDQLELSKFPKDLVFISPRQEHSRKPPIGPFLKQQLWPSGESKQCLEMFARELVPDWITWGNESKSGYYLLGYNGEETQCRLMVFSKTSDQRTLKVVEDPRVLKPSDASRILEEIHSKDSIDAGGLQLLCEAFGILGCFRFLEGYYLFLITKRKPLGSLAGHTVYGVADTTLIPLSCTNESWSERRYRKLLLSGLDLTKDFFFSYTYNLSYTVQHNLTQQGSFDPFECIYVWNEYLTRDLRTALKDNKWVLPLVHGSWQQRNLSIFGKLVTLTLISRRSRRFAGTRYLKRGINQQGWVANEVETEQIISLHHRRQSGIPSLSSMVQLRGSIPLFWGQGTSALNPRPDIVLYNMDPLYAATAKHFEDLFDRYGGPVVVLNLVKSVESHPRETILRREFAKALVFLNQHVFQDQIVHLPIDFKQKMHKTSNLFFKEIEPKVKSSLKQTGFCVVQSINGRTALNSNKAAMKPQLQEGVSRSNCIDCLDRTNIWQYVYGLIALGSQLCSLGLLETDEIDPHCSLAYQLMEMYEIMGNVIALQYGGSEAHGKFFEKMRGRSEAATKSKELLTSIRRYYSNAVSDPEKQDAINLFLDYYMHCGVDWEMNKTNFGSSSTSTTAANLVSRASLAASSSNENTSSTSLLRRSSTKSLSSIQLFPLPIISQTGDPESIPGSEQTSKKENSATGGWSLKFWFRSSSAARNTQKKKKDFKLPENKGPSLESFEEMLKANPVVEVRLYDGKKSRGVTGRSHHSTTNFETKLMELEKQETSTEQTSHVGAGLVSGSLFDEHQTQSSQITNKAEFVTMLSSLKQQDVHKSVSCQSRFASFSELNTNFKIQSSTGLEMNSAAAAPVVGGVVAPPLNKLQSKSVSIEQTVPKWSWFGGLSRASTDSHKKKQTSGKQLATHRAASTPADVGQAAAARRVNELDNEGDFPFRNISTRKRLDVLDEFWNEYWSITEQSLTSELTLAEKIGNNSERTVKNQMQRRSLQTSLSHVSESAKNNVFLDGLISQFLDKSLVSKEDEKWVDNVIGIPRNPAPPPQQGKDWFNEDDEGKSDTENGLKSNINSLLFASSSGPIDRILEKWFLADKKAEADYHRNLSWIVSPVN
eukprot:g8050.t1